MKFSIRMPGEYAPITWWGRIPVYVTTCIVIMYCVGMVFSVFARPLGYAALLDELLFSTYGIRQLKIWQVVSYAFISPPSLWFLIEMLMAYLFGVEVERFLGRKNYVALYVALLLAPPIFLTLGALLGHERTYFGAGAINLAIFIAFVFINPNVEIFFSITAKWMGMAIVVLNSLIAISAMDWTGFFVLWLECAVVVFFLRRMGIRSLQFALPSVPRLPIRRSVKFSSKLSSSDQERSVKESEEDLVESIDPILDKIARDGIGSLTSKERERLECARKALLEKKIDTK